MNYKVMSVRLPQEMISEIKRTAQAENTNVSAMFRDKFTDIGQPNLFAEKSIQVDKGIADHLWSIGGGSAIGLMVYKAVYQRLGALEDGNKWKEQRELLSLVSGVGSALIVGYGILKLVKTLREE